MLESRTLSPVTAWAALLSDTRTEPRVACMLGKSFTAELYPPDPGLLNEQMKWEFGERRR